MNENCWAAEHKISQDRLSKSLELMPAIKRKTGAKVTEGAEKNRLGKTTKRPKKSHTNNNTKNLSIEMNEKRKSRAVSQQVLISTCGCLSCAAVEPSQRKPIDVGLPKANQKTCKCNVW